MMAMVRLDALAALTQARNLIADPECWTRSAPARAWRAPRKTGAGQVDACGGHRPCGPALVRVRGTLQGLRGAERRARLLVPPRGCRPAVRGRARESERRSAARAR